VDKRLILFYRKNAEKYIVSSKIMRMTGQYDFFEKFLPRRFRVLDAGFGSGRDTLYFLGLGCETFAVDVIPEFFDNLSSIGVKNVYCMDVLETPYEHFFDAIWANDFLSMFRLDEYSKVFDRFYDLLADKGYVYISIRSSIKTFMNGDTYGLSFFEDKEEIAKYIEPKFEVMAMEEFIPENAPLENNIWYQYVLRKK